jgi:hypothetical protein
MQKLMGIMHFDRRALSLKRQALFFDWINLWCVEADRPITGLTQAQDADFDFLLSRKFLFETRNIQLEPYLGPVFHKADEYVANWIESQKSQQTATIENAEIRSMQRDGLTRALAGENKKGSPWQSVALCEKWLPQSIVPNGGRPIHPDVMELAVEALPVPDDTCSWEAILDFKEEMRDKQWHFRRFLVDIASKRQSENEIRDDIEWTVNEYRKAMEIHKLKSSQSMVDVFIISPIEVLENLVTFKWSKIAKGLLSVNKRKVELMEAEMKAPGRECAYIFDARERFGKSSK